MASPNLSEIVTTTLRDRSGKLADNVSESNALLMRVNRRGNRKAASGRTIIQELEYAEGTFSWYSGYEVIDITPADVFTAAEYDWKQCAGAVSASGLEIDVQNTGRAQIIDLMESRIKNAEKTIKNNLTAGLYSDGTGNAGKEIGGLQLIVDPTPTVGTVGGINAATYSFWQNQLYDFSDESVTASSTTIQTAMNSLWLDCVRGSDKVDLIMADKVFYEYYLASLQNIQRITGDEMAQAGFTSLKFMDADVVFESSDIGASTMYFLNTDYLFLRYAPNRNFTPLENVQSINQDAVVQLITWAGNLTCSNRSLQGVMVL